MDESMRWVRAVCVLGLATCGYDPLPIPDAPPDGIGDGSHVVLTWQLATTAASGAPPPHLESPPFASGAAPQVRIATSDGLFAPASYSSDPATPGWIGVPRSYFAPSGDASTAARWRLEYTLPGGVPHEVQWAPDDRLGHLVVPMVGRLDRPVAPTGSGYRVTLSNFTFSGSHATSVLTTGLWTTGPTAAPSGMTVDYDFSNA